MLGTVINVGGLIVITKQGGELEKCKQPVSYFETFYISLYDKSSAIMTMLY